MKKSILIAALRLFSLSAMAQDAKPEGGLVFITVKGNLITSIKNQSRSSIYWSFSALGLLEPKLLRLDKGEHDLSEVFIVHRVMEDRRTNYVRCHGGSSSSLGGGFYDIIYCVKNYGLVPQEAMSGIMYGDTLPIYNELDAAAERYIGAIAKDRLTKLTLVWKKGPSATYDIYLGVYPENFTYKGKEYTPKTFAESPGPKVEGYVSLTSYTHRPSYSQFAIEIQDNWRNGLSYDLLLGEFMTVMDSVTKRRYTFAWGSGVNEQGFAHDGITITPDAAKGAELTGSDMTRWIGLITADKRKELASKPFPEMEIVQEMRQTAFDNWETTDGHRMVIYGITKDQNGKEYPMVKNSWGTSGKYEGIQYASGASVAYEIMNILVHKDALPKEIAKKLGIG